MIISHTFCHLIGTSMSKKRLSAKHLVNISKRSTSMKGMYTFISTVMIHRVNSHLLPLALTGRESPLKTLVTTPMRSLESGLSSSETHSESEEVTEKGNHNQNRGGGCSSCVCTAGVVPLGGGLFVQCMCCLVLWGKTPFLKWSPCSNYLGWPLPLTPTVYQLLTGFHTQKRRKHAHGVWSLSLKLVGMYNNPTLSLYSCVYEQEKIISQTHGQYK